MKHLFVIILGLCLLSSAARALAEPVSTHNFGLITRGMSIYEVRDRLGAPDNVTAITNAAGTVIVGAEWYYAGDRRYPGTYFVFLRGKMAEKGRTGRSTTPP